MADGKKTINRADAFRGVRKLKYALAQCTRYKKRFDSIFFLCASSNVINWARKPHAIDCGAHHHRYILSVEYAKRRDLLPSQQSHKLLKIMFLAIRNMSAVKMAKNLLDRPRKKKNNNKSKRKKQRKKKHFNIQIQVKQNTTTDRKIKWNKCEKAPITSDWIRILFSSICTLIM